MARFMGLLGLMREESVCRGDLNYSLFNAVVFSLVNGCQPRIYDQSGR
jgi:hypothetical protein